MGIEIPISTVSVTIEPGRSLLQFVTTNCLIHLSGLWKYHLTIFSIDIICSSLAAIVVQVVVAEAVCILLVNSKSSRHAVKVST